MAGAVEPGAWQLSVADSTAAEQVANQVGLRVYNGTGASITGSFANFIVHDTLGNLAFPGITLSGVDQTVTSHYSLDITDSRGSGAGWHLSGTSTTMTSGGNTLPTTATTVQSAPGLVCDPGSSCTLATNGTAYPLVLPAAAAPPLAIPLANAAATTGQGLQTVDFTFSLLVPANARPGSYASTWTITIATGP